MMYGDNEPKPPPGRAFRKVVQIAVTSCVNESTLYQTTIALCSDGTIWESEWSGFRGRWAEWSRLPPVPVDD